MVPAMIYAEQLFIFCCSEQLLTTFRHLFFKKCTDIKHV